MERILVAYDDSEKARKALKYAIEEAKTRDITKITAAYVEKKENRRLRSMLEDYKVDIERDKLLKDLESEKDEILGEAKKIGEEEEIEIETVAIENINGISTDFVKYANENDFDHIVVGNRGRSGISRITLGSVAEEIIRRSPCDVTVIR